MPRTLRRYHIVRRRIAPTEHPWFPQYQASGSVGTIENMRTTVLVMMLVGCGGGDHTPSPDAPMGTPDTAMPVMAAQMIGPMGGTLDVPGVVTLDVPAGALGVDTMITVAASTMTAPSGAVTPVYTFGPSGLVFAHPVMVTLELPPGTLDGDLYWSKPSGQTGFDDVGGIVENGQLEAEIVHFSDGYVGPAETTRTVTGSQVVAHVSASAVDLSPTDLSMFPVAALVEDGNGGYTELPGSGHSDGTFTIDNVPDGNYWLRVPGARGGVALFRTNASAVDAGYATEGRATQTAELPNTQLTLDVTNLAPWQNGDMLELISSEANSWHFNLEQQAVAGAPAVDDTSLALTIDMTDTTLSVPNHIDGSLTPPDRVFLTQTSVHTTAENTQYSSVSRLFEAGPFTVASGQTSTLAGAFTDASSQQTLSLQIDGAAITASRTEEARACDVAVADWYVLLDASPGSAQYVGAGATADFLLLGVPVNATSTITATNMGYGIPVTGTWTPEVSATFAEQCKFVPPGATSPVRMFAGLIYNLTVAGAQQAPIGARLGQVRAPTINGASLYTTTSGYGLTPTLAWTAPSSGTPTSYTVTAYRLYSNGGQGARDWVLTMTTDQTSVTIPPGYLQTGESYVFEIDANVDAMPSGTVYRTTLPHDGSRILGVMSTP